MRMFAVGLAFFAASLGASVTACARVQRPAPPMVQGRIVDLKPNWMMLNDGTQIVVPSNVVRWSDLALGAVVRVEYEERDGKKIATSMNYLEGFPGQRGL